MAAPSSTTAAKPSNKSYAVFINHYGVDVEKSFAESLYLRLLDNGLTAFQDKEFQTGSDIASQIEHAVRTAAVYVAIFSPGYAKSHRCLNDLPLMLESAPIIPVFHRVTPAQVRWTKGDYRRALQTHKEKGRHDPNTIGKWRNALSQVANNSGFELETRNGEELEMDLLDKVVKRLLEMLKTPDLHVAKFPTGLDEKLKHFGHTVVLQQQQSGRPQILGIWGLGGVGKTTLAKEFFNRKKSYYHKSCFLTGVGDNAAKGSSLQRELLKSLTSIDKLEHNVDDKGKEMLVELLKSSYALLILDDVDDASQVDELLPVQNHDLNPGSLILITSRNKDVLIRSRVEDSSIYRLTGLSAQHSLELFCSYAFSQSYPAPGFESLVHEFLQSCNGLPLSLKVVVELLYGRDRTDWEEELEILQQALPPRYMRHL